MRGAGPEPRAPLLTGKDRLRLIDIGQLAPFELGREFVERIAGVFVLVHDLTYWRCGVADPVDGLDGEPCTVT